MQLRQVLPALALGVALAAAAIMVVTLIDSLGADGGWDGVVASLSNWLVGPAYHGALVLLAAAGVAWLTRR